MSETVTMTLSEFLLARIAEDEGAADLVLRPYGDHAATNDAKWWTSERRVGFVTTSEVIEAPLLTRMTPQRVLAECDAKRRIVMAHDAERLTEPDDEDEVWSDCPDCWQAPPCHTLRLLALPYADHPDYREEWRP